MLGARGYCRWGRSGSRRPWPVVWKWCNSPWLCGYSLVVGNVLLLLILESTVRSSENRGWTVVVVRRHCPSLGGRRRAVMIAGVACFDRRFWCRCTALWCLAACGDNGVHSLRRPSFLASLSCSPAVGGVCGR